MVHPKLVVFLSVALVASVAQAEYYQCENEWGKKIFSDQPCGDDAKVLKLKEPTIYKPNKSTNEWDAIIASNDKREYEREIEKRQEAIKEYRKARDAQLNELRDKKATAADNLAGANWEASISKEMDVVQDQYRGLIESEEKEIEYLRKRIDTLTGKSNPY